MIYTWELIPIREGIDSGFISLSSPNKEKLLSWMFTGLKNHSLSFKGEWNRMSGHWKANKIGNLEDWM